MKVYLAGWLRPFSLLIALSKTLISKSGENIPVTVQFKSDKNDDCVRFEREFNFNNKTLYFYSKMEPIGGNSVIEWMQSGIGWGCAFVYSNGKVSLLHNGYYIKLFGKNVKLPLEAFIGKGYAFERAIDDNSFEMYMHIKHSLYGIFYSYSGIFHID